MMGEQPQNEAGQSLSPRQALMNEIFRFPDPVDEQQQRTSSTFTPMQSQDLASDAVIEYLSSSALQEMPFEEVWYQSIF